MLPRAAGASSSYVVTSIVDHSRPSESTGLTRVREALYHDPAPIGGVAVAVLLGTSALLQVPVSIPLLIAGFCGTTCVYWADRVIFSPEDTWSHPGRQQWVRAHRPWLLVEGAVLLVVGGLAGVHLNSGVLLVGGILAVIGGLHLVTVEEYGRLLNAMGVGKPLLVALVWAVGGSVLPVLQVGMVIGPEEIALTTYRLLFILPNLLLSDWGDRRGDAAAGLRPWAEHWTGGGIRWVATVLLVVAIVGAAGVALVYEIPLVWIDVLGPGCMLIAIWCLQPSRPDHRFTLDAVVAWPGVTAMVALVFG